MMCLLVQEGGATCFPVRMLTTPWQRIRGLLDTKPEASAVLLRPCHAVHTYGMSYPIDIAFLSNDMHVLSSIRCLPKNSSVSCFGATCVVERPAQSQAWLEVGKHVRIEESQLRSQAMKEESSYES